MFLLRFHPSCLSCHECSKPLHGDFWVVDGRRYCQEHRLAAHPRWPLAINNIQSEVPCNIMEQVWRLWWGGKSWIWDTEGRLKDYNKFKTRVAEVVRGHRGPPPKSLDSDENFKPEHTLFCRELRFVAIYALFGDLWVKNSVSWARSALLHGIYCIFHWVNFANLRLRTKPTHLMRKL